MIRFHCVINPANPPAKYLLLLLDQNLFQWQSWQRKPEDHETVKHRLLLITTYFGPIA
jgi:hypothetical protein